MEKGNGKEKLMEVYDVVMKLIGPVEPVGATHVDTERFENLKRLTELTSLLVSEIDRIGYENKDAYQASIKQAAEHCHKFLSVDLGIGE